LKLRAKERADNLKRLSQPFLLRRAKMRIATSPPSGLSAIAIGTHTWIVDIIAPASANAGDLVNSEAKVYNLSGETIYIGVNCLYDDIVLYFSPEFKWAGPWTIESFTASFIMPNKDVTLYVVSYYWLETEWIQDDSRYAVITLAGVPPAAGTISKMEFEYDEARATIPAYDVPQGQRGLVHIWGRNNTTSAQRMGISWIVRDPDGITVEEYSDWEDWPYTGAGKDHEFIGGRFNLNKRGTYLLDVGLIMNPDDPVIVDEYRGVLCTVVEAPPELETLEVRINPVGAGYVTTSPEPVGGVEHNWQFPYGTVVYVTAHPYSGYIFKSWSGEMKDTTAITAPVYLMTEHRLITAHFTVSEPEFQNFAITRYDSVPLGEKLSVFEGQKVTIHMTVDYRGPAIDGAIWTAIGWQVGVVIPEFVETFNSRTPVHFDESTEFVTYEFDCDVDILTLPPAEELLYGTTLDMYAKIMEVPGPDIFTPTYTGVIEWTKPIEEYELIQHHIYHFAYIYDGDVEVTTATFKTDPFTPSAWMGEKFASKLEEEVRARGEHVLEVKVYVDTSPLLWTDYRIEVINTPFGEAVEAAPGIAAIHIPIAVTVLIIALAIIAVIVVATLMWERFQRTFQRKVGLEDMKPAWGKEALILDVRDAEEHWERTLTPMETLEGMSEQELRDKLDQIAEEEVPTEPEIPWALVAVGGVCVLAAVALAAYGAVPRRKE